MFAQENEIDCKHNGMIKLVCTECDSNSNSATHDKNTSNNKATSLAENDMKMMWYTT